MGQHYIAKNSVKITVDKDYLANILMFLGDKVEACYQAETDRIIQILILQIEAGAVVPEDTEI